MPTSPIGALSLAESLARDTLAACATWQSWVGVMNPETAKLSIYYDALPPPAAGGEHTAAELQGYRPYCLVATFKQDGHTMTRDAFGPGLSPAERGVIVLEIEADVAETDQDDPAEAGMKFKNKIGAIKGELLALAGQAGYLDIIEITQAGYYRARPEEAQAQGDHIFCQLFLEWGSKR